MNQIKTKHGAVAMTAFASLLISCASDSGHEAVGQTGAGQTGSGAVNTSSAANNDVSGTEALLRAARASAGVAKSDAKSCFDKLHGCIGDGGALSQACVDQLTGCLPTKPPAPIGCPQIPDLTPEEIKEIDDAVGKADDFAGQAIDFAGGVIDALLDGGIALPLPDGGFTFPTGSGAGPRGGQAGAGARPDHNKDRGRPAATALADGGVPVRSEPDAQVPSWPTIDPDASIGGGELCGVPLPEVPIGALKACADKAAADLKSGQDPLAVASAALSCIEAPFQDDIAKLCSDAKTECAKPDAPPNICGNVNDLCSALLP